MATTFNQENMDCAVLIAGGGLAGLTLARCLADAFIGSSRKIILVDRANLSKSDAAVDSVLDVRSTALSHTTVDIYRQLKLWSQLQVGAAPIAAIHVSDKGHIAKAELSAEESGRDALGCVVENKELASVLLEAVKSHPNITLLDRSTVSEPKALQGGYQLTVMGESQAENRHITTALLIVADGTQSPLRTALGIDQQTDDYQQYALVTNIETQKPHAGVAYERFLPDGALACLPLMPVAGKHRNAIVWSMPRERFAALQSFASDELLEAVQKVLGWRLGKVLAAGQVAGFPLALTQSKELFRSHVVLVGNAAHTLHPVAGQGFNLVVREAWALRELVSRAVKDGAVLGDHQMLSRYAQVTARDRERTVQASDMLMRLFGNQRLPRQLLRGAGLSLIDHCSVLRQAFTEQMSGRRGMAAIFSLRQ